MADVLAGGETKAGGLVVGAGDRRVAIGIRTNGFAIQGVVVIFKPLAGRLVGWPEFLLERVIVCQGTLWMIACD